VLVPLLLLLWRGEAADGDVSDVKGSRRGVSGVPGGSQDTGTRLFFCLI
jgi:hypothetical protein